MENIRIRCRCCNREIEAYSGKSVSCGCGNMATIRNGIITARDLSQVVMLTNTEYKPSNNVLKNEDLMWQEERRKRKVKRLDFEVR